MRFDAAGFDEAAHAVFGQAFGARDQPHAAVVAHFRKTRTRKTDAQHRRTVTFATRQQWRSRAFGKPVLAS